MLYSIDDIFIKKALLSQAMLNIVYNSFAYELFVSKIMHCC